MPNTQVPFTVIHILVSSLLIQSPTEPRKDWPLVHAAQRHTLLSHSRTHRATTIKHMYMLHNWTMLIDMDRSVWQHCKCPCTLSHDQLWDLGTVGRSSWWVHVCNQDQRPSCPALLPPFIAPVGNSVPPTMQQCCLVPVSLAAHSPHTWIITTTTITTPPWWHSHHITITVTLASAPCHWMDMLRMTSRRVKGIQRSNFGL